MHRSIVESLVSCAASLAIAVGVFAAGTGAMQTSPQSVSHRVALDPDPESVFGAAAATSTVSLRAGPDDLAWGSSLPGTQTSTASLPGGAAGGCRGSSVVGLASSGIRGSAKLCSTPEGIRAAMDVDNLAIGDAYTVWLAYFDRGSACRGPRCTLDDTLGDNPAGVLGRLDGAVASGRGGSFSGQIRDLQLPLGSQASLLLFGHGRASTGHLRSRARQLLTPQSPRLGAPLAGTVADGEIGSVIAYAAFEFRPAP